VPLFVAVAVAVADNDQVNDYATVLVLLKTLPSRFHNACRHRRQQGGGCACSAPAQGLHAGALP
jgi:hypothetical protein